MRSFNRPPSHPGEIIKGHYLEPLKISVSELADRLEVSRKTVSKIVNGHGAVTPDMALRLSKVFKTTPELWLNLQRNHDLWHARRSHLAWRRVRSIPRLHRTVRGLAFA